jgi:ABC-2 type transport system permease protein
MLWHKAWDETRWRFVVGFCLMVLTALSVVFGYPQVARKLLPMVTQPEGNDLLSQALRESIELSRSFRGYVWLNAFRQNFSQMGTLFAVLLGSGGLRAESVGALYTLSLPASRRALVTTRAASGLLELLAMTMIPSLLISLFAPAIGERYSFVDTLVQGGCLFVGTSVFFGLTSWLATMFSDVWRPGLFACGVAIVVSLCEVGWDSVAPFGIFHVMHGVSYFRGTGVPWVGLIAAAALSAAMLYGAVTAVERQDF